MSLDKIKEAVLKASRSEAEHISASASKQSKERLESQKENLHREFEYLYQSRCRLIEEEYSRKLAHFQGTASKELLEAKNACIRAIFDGAVATVLSWSPGEYSKAMEGLLQRITGGRGGLIRVHEDDRGIFTVLLEKINNGRGENSRLGMDGTDTLQSRGGFVFVSGDFEVDATVETIFSDIEQSLLPRIAQDLADI